MNDEMLRAQIAEIEARTRATHAHAALLEEQAKTVAAERERDFATPSPSER